MVSRFAAAATVIRSTPGPAFGRAPLLFGLCLSRPPVNSRGSVNPNLSDHLRQSAEQPKQCSQYKPNAILSSKTCDDSHNGRQLNSPECDPSHARHSQRSAGMAFRHARDHRDQHASGHADIKRMDRCSAKIKVQSGILPKTVCCDQSKADGRPSKTPQQGSKQSRRGCGRPPAPQHQAGQTRQCKRRHPLPILLADQSENEMC